MDQLRNPSHEHSTDDHYASDPLFDYPALSRYLGISASKLRRMVSMRQIPHVKIGKTVRFKLSQIHAYLEERTVK